MDCLRSFNFQVDTDSTFSGAAVKQWTVGLDQTFWSVTGGTLSTYNIEGFKNINVYGIDLIGSLTSKTSVGTAGVIVDDWSIDITVGGQIPLIGGNVTASPNFYNISADTANNKIFPLSKYSNSVKFASPIQSAKFIQLGATNAQGTGFQTAGSVNLYWNWNFIIYYKFEE